MRDIRSAAAVMLCLACGRVYDSPSALAQPAGPTDHRAAKVPERSVAELPVRRADPNSGYLGIVADDRADHGRGVRVLAVRPGGPAEKARFRAGDLITVVAETRVRELADMADVLARHGAGDSVSFDLLRDGKHHTLGATLGRPPAAPATPEGSTQTVPAPAAQPRKDVEPVAGLPKESAAQPQQTTADAQKPPADCRAQIERLLRRIEQLERRVGQLERALSDSVTNR